MSLMAQMDARQLLAGLLDGAAAQAVDVGAGDLHVVQAPWLGQPTVWVCFDYGASQGSIGVQEAQQLVASLRHAQQRHARVVFVMESGGIRVTDSTAGIASFRHVIRAAAQARLAGMRMLAVVGRCAFGGASILACICERCVVFPHSILAMSGPRLLTHEMGEGIWNARDASVVAQWLGGAARARASGRFDLVHDVPACRAALATWAGSAPLPPAPESDGMACPELPPAQELAASLGQPGPGLMACGQALLQPLDAQAAGWERLSAQVYRLRAAVAPGVHVLALEAPEGARVRDVAVLMQQLQALRPRLASGAVQAKLLIVLDAQSHAARLEDEQAAFSVVLADLVLLLHVMRREGVQVQLRVTGRCGGGIFAALSAGVGEVVMEPSARLVVLPRAALAALGKQESPEAGSAQMALAVGVVDRVLEHDASGLDAAWA
ncbi:hypothetical protein EBQ24_05815 [Allofranklinella schreckenbergeri]|uniref:Uncharacterized protein n=1 Tax=Allofranklinella schreckenbergeri TaxID=1076744 RepID=A0A3M6R4H9_9BURK|nr:hypothetical protein [Allofranklinella schreckenbergeri]RMX09958.1 hypothetical protein EBQ24_05815 [Allofranklinella schreckenbergeri]